MSVSRRTAWRALAAGAAATASLFGYGNDQVAAGPGRCRKTGQKCPRHVNSKHCCSGVCCDGACCADDHSCTETGCCPVDQACVDRCCPPETVGCTEQKLADGSVILSCLCPTGKYDASINQCVPCPVACAADDDCCEGLCCDGACCGCRAAGSACIDDDECCTDPADAHQTVRGRCLDGTCRCCATHLGIQAGSCPTPNTCALQCQENVVLRPDPDLCCDFPQVTLASCVVGACECTFLCCTPDAEGQCPDDACPRGTIWLGTAGPHDGVDRCVA